MSVVDFRRLRSSSSRVAAEPDLRIRGPLPGVSTSWHADLCELIASMLAVVGGMSATDIRIVDAVRREGSVRAAAKALAPDNPSYRAYVQRRVKLLRERLQAYVR